MMFKHIKPLNRMLRGNFPSAHEPEKRNKYLFVNNLRVLKSNTTYYHIYFRGTASS